MGVDSAVHGSSCEFAETANLQMGYHSVSMVPEVSPRYTVCMLGPQAETYKVFNELHCGVLHVNIRLLEEVMYDTHFLKRESDNKWVEIRVKLRGYI